MTADSQQLQHLQHRSPSYPGKGDTLPPAAGVPHQQQQQQQQLPNGTGSSHCNSNSNSSSTCNSGNAMIHANNSNLIAAGHLAQAAGPAHNAPSSGSALNAGKCEGDGGRGASVCERGIVYTGKTIFNNKQTKNRREK